MTETAATGTETGIAAGAGAETGTGTGRGGAVGAAVGTATGAGNDHDPGTGESAYSVGGEVEAGAAAEASVVARARGGAGRAAPLGSYSSRLPTLFALYILQNIPLVYLTS